ncbi:MAG TPA: hypothetical protein VMC83_01880 [Streptosporangiaceae bacterium]|nr:hypothetical protein [Streptosporangiaceae bacterium]
MAVALNATEYMFQGEGITASYFPGGAGGPITEGGTETYFTYQDHHMAKAFGQQDIAVNQIEDVGALISVPLVKEDSFALGGGAVTTFTVIVPAMGVTADSPQSFKTKSITTVQAAVYVERLAFPALQTYKVDHLDGTASIHALPE